LHLDAMRAPVGTVKMQKKVDGKQNLIII